MTSVVQLLLDEMTDVDLDELASRLRPRLTRPHADDGWLRGAKRIAEYIDAPASRVHALSSAKRIPVHHDGSNLIARKSELDAWVRAGGAIRP